jgi:hypothetical protein
MTRAIATLIILSSLLGIGCQDLSLRISACDPCIEIEPDSGTMELTFTFDQNHPKIPFEVYMGTYKTGLLVHSDTAVQEKITLTLRADRSYAVAANYMVEGKKVRVINTGKISTREIGCGGDSDGNYSYYCWYVVPGSVDVRLN